MDFTNTLVNMHPHRPVSVGFSRRVSLLDRLSATQDPSPTVMPHASLGLSISPSPSLEPSLVFHAASSQEHDSASSCDPGHDPDLTVGKSCKSDLPPPSLGNDMDRETAGPTTNQLLQITASYCKREKSLCGDACLHCTRARPHSHLNASNQKPTSSYR